MVKVNKTSILNTLLLIGIFIMLNLIGIRHFIRADLTSKQRYSLSESSKNVMRNLDDRLYIKVFFSKGLPGQYAGIERYLRDTLEEYRIYSNGNFEYEFVDPGTEQGLIQEAQSFNIPPRQFKAFSNEKMEIVRGFTGLVVMYKNKKEPIPYIDSVENLEYEITSIVRRLTSQDPNSVAVFLPGLRNDDFDYTMQQLYEQLGKIYTFIPVDLTDMINPSTDALLVLAPHRPFSDWEMFVMDQYLMSGGRIAFFAHSYRANIQKSETATLYPANFNEFLSNYGIAVNKDLLVDAQCVNIVIQTQEGFQQATQRVAFMYFPKLTDLNSEHVITRELTEVNTFYPSSIDTTLAESLGYDLEVLMRTSSKSRRDTGQNIRLAPVPRPDLLTFHGGNYPVGGIVSGKFQSMFADSGPVETDDAGEYYNGPFIEQAENDAHLLVIGDGNIPFDAFMRGDQMKFMQNVVDWMVQSEELITIRSKDISQKPLREITGFSRKLVRWANQLLPSILVIAVGIALWQSRRIRKKAMMSE